MWKFNQWQEKRNQIELDILNHKRAIAFKKKLVFFAIAASAWPVEWQSGCTGLGAIGLKFINIPKAVYQELQMITKLEVDYFSYNYHR